MPDFLQARPRLETAGLWVDFSAAICGLILGAIAGTPGLFPRHGYAGKLGLPELSVSPDLTSLNTGFTLA